MTYRILSLDGGGAWAILEAMALKELYGNIGGRAILSQFDLVASNSGGSIVLGALIADFTPQRIIDLFLSDTERAKIFVDLPWYKKLVRVIGLGPRYSTSGKRDGNLHCRFRLRFHPGGVLSQLRQRSRIAGLGGAARRCDRRILDRAGELFRPSDGRR
jgi:hypothetical protein